MIVFQFGNRRQPISPKYKYKYKSPPCFLPSLSTESQNLSGCLLGNGPPANIYSWLLLNSNVSRRELNNSISGNIISEIAFLVLKVISLPEMPKFLFLKTKSKSSTLVHTTVKKLQISFWMRTVLIDWWNLNGGIIKFKELWYVWLMKLEWWVNLNLNSNLN